MAYMLSIGSLQTPSYLGGGTALRAETILIKEKPFEGFLVLFAPSHLSVIFRGHSGRFCNFSSGKQNSPKMFPPALFLSFLCLCYASPLLLSVIIHHKHYRLQQPGNLMGDCYDTNFAVIQRITVPFFAYIK